MSEESTQSAPALPHALLRGEQVDLRPIEEDDLPLLHRWRNDPALAAPLAAPRPATLAQLRRRYVDEPALDEDGGELLVVRKDGVAVGTVQFHRVWYGPSSPACNIGIEIAPEQRGHGYGAEAQRLLADYLLFAYPIARVEAGTDLENVPEQRALEKAGFVREGVARAASWRDGRWQDMAIYSRVRGDA
jgi:RimJ/RimL family protein N-acetyltransferase